MSLAASPTGSVMYGPTPVGYVVPLGGAALPMQFEVDGLTVGTKYEFVVAAQNAAGKVISAQASFETYFQVGQYGQLCTTDQIPPSPFAIHPVLESGRKVSVCGRLRIQGATRPRGLTFTCIPQRQLTGGGGNG
jgi:hypothetical protein